VMDNRNNAVPVDRIDARDLTDTHRRCLCTAAAAQFGLAWQLWAKESLEDPHQRPSKPAPAKAAPRTIPARPAPSKDELQRQALQKVTDAGLRTDAIMVMLQELGGPDCRAIGMLPDNYLKALAERGAKPEKIQAWNAAAAEREVEADDLPMAWDQEDAA